VLLAALRSACQRLFFSESFMGVCGANQPTPPVAVMRISRALRNDLVRSVHGGPRIAQLSGGNGGVGHVEPGSSEDI